nr:MAG: putative RNA polymerase [Eriocheir sinensis botourmia-like virus 3]
MTQWYTNTIKLWQVSLDKLDYGEHARRSFSTALLGILTPKEQSKQVGRLWIYAQYGVMEKYLKWTTANLWASALEQTELPPMPDFVKITGGNPYLYEVREWKDLCSQSRLGSLNNLNKKIMITITKDIYMTKNCSLPVEESFVKENIDKHKKTLCTENLCDPLSSRMERLIKVSIQQCADDIFGPLPAQDNHITKKGKHITVPLERVPPSRIPSLGASVNNGRHKGGAAGDLLKNHSEKYDLPEPEEGYLHSYCTYKTDYLDVRTPHDPELFLEAERSSRSSAYTRREVCAQVVPLLEAFKVRTITKGDADQYHLARRWQKVIHSQMRKQQNCKLIGQPCNSAYLSQIFGNSPLFVRNDDGFFVSGDYESATDLLHPALSEFANEAICQRMRVPLEDQIVLKQCLTGHELKYTAKGEYYKQQWGQLMGSPTSFPILCLINLAATKVAYEEFLRKIGSLQQKEFLVLEEIPMCVNGDDILFWCYTQDHYNIWKQVTKECGLKFSLGKNYTHKKVAIINSQLYFFHTQKHKTVPSFSPHAMFRQSGSFEPQLLFQNGLTLNSRLICGGQRSEAVTGASSSYQSIGDYDETFLSILAAELKDNKISPQTYCGGKLTTRQHSYLHRHSDLSYLQKLEYIQKCQRGDQDERNAIYEDYLKWRKTIEARGRKLLEMLQGDAGVRSRPAMREAVKLSFNNVQLSKLKRFRLWGLEDVDKDTPHFMPQTLGGLGLFPPSDHKFTIMDYLEVATLEGCPRRAEKWIKKLTPKFPLPPFMKAVNHELALQKDLLGIKSEFKDYEEIGLLRFLGEEDGFWEHSFLTGFLKEQNMVLGVDDMGEARMFAQNNSRKFGDKQLTIEKTRQIKRGVELSMWTTRKVGGKREVVRRDGENCFEKIDFESVSIYRSYKPSPKYE